MKNKLLVFLFLGMFTSCSTENSEEELKEFVPEDVIVGIKSGTAIKEVFDFVNQFDHNVKSIKSLTFTSDLPSDSLQYVLKTLNEKTYTNDGVNFFVTGYLHYQTNEITLFPKLFEMHREDFQKDWLSSMEHFELEEKHHIDLNSGIIYFKVPKGKEPEWEKRFETYEIVEWAELNYFAEITRGTN